MSIPQTITWLPAFGNTASIATSQPVPAGTFMVLKSNKAKSSDTTFGGPYYYDGVARTVSITAGATTVGVTVLEVTGLSAAVDGAGNPTSPFVVTTETLGGPATSTTTYTARIYLRVDSILALQGSLDLSAGFGTSGITDYLFMDYNRTGWYATAQGYCPNRSTLTYTIYQSLTKPETINAYQGNVTPFPFEVPATLVGTLNSTALQLVNLPTPVTMVWATIAANSAIATETFYFTVLQQGIR